MDWERFNDQFRETFGERQDRLRAARKRRAARQAEIYGCFDGLQDIHPDKSTEFLLAMTADMMKCSYADVAAALEAHAEGGESDAVQSSQGDDS